MKKNSRVISLTLGCFVILLYSSVLAQPQQKTPLKALKAAAMLDVEAGKIVPRPVVLIEGERIRAVGSDLAIPAEAEVMDLGDAVLLPGLIDCHTHVTTTYRFL